MTFDCADPQLFYNQLYSQEAGCFYAFKPTHLCRHESHDYRSTTLYALMSRHLIFSPINTRVAWFIRDANVCTEQLPHDHHDPTNW